MDVVCKHADNLYCADCGARGPRWSSVKLGVLICAQCAGIHRKLGTHISFVQSVTIDKWKLEWVELIEKVGNRISNLYYEANVPEHIKKPSGADHTSTGGDTMDGPQAAKLEKWIRNKYELKLFVVEGSVDPKDIVKDGLDPRHVEPYGRPVIVSPKKSKKKVSVEPVNQPPTEAAAVQVVAAASPLSTMRLEEPAIVLPTSFNWKDNMFISSWARAHNVAGMQHTMPSQ